MRTKFFTGVALVALVATTAVLWASWASSAAAPSACGTSYAPVLDPANFVSVIDNPYFPLPVGRKLVYTGVKDGQSQIGHRHGHGSDEGHPGHHDHGRARRRHPRRGACSRRRSTSTRRTSRGTSGTSARTRPRSTPTGTTDTSGSFVAGVDGAQPGIIMEANPQIPDAYRQECSAGQAEDTAWVVATDRFRRRSRTGRCATSSRPSRPRGSSPALTTRRSTDRGSAS